VENQYCAVDVMGADRCLWRYVVKETGRNVLVEPPAFEIDGRQVGGSLARVAPQDKPAVLPDGVTETTYVGHVVDTEDLVQKVVFRIAKESPLVCFQYRLRAKSEHTIACKKCVSLDLKGLEPQGVKKGKCTCGSRVIAVDDSHALLVSCKGDSMCYCLEEGNLAVCAQEPTTVSLSAEQGFETPWFVLGAIAGDKEAILAFA